ncbi:MAG: carboxypeptidase regulatory-like domain-containing protein [Blastocatellia bacterium]
MRRLFTLTGCAIVLLMLRLGAGAQTGVITGRVVSEDGGGMPNVPVFLSQVGSNQRAINAQPERTATDEDGNFRFTGLAPRLYSVNVLAAKGYVYQPVPASERNNRGYHRIGDSVTLTLIRGGVITGRVTTATGEPMIGVQVSAMMVRDFEGSPLRQQGGGRPRTTDDRGVYRLYGLTPGTYVVFTRGAMSGSQISAYDGYAPAYHPSSPRETAAEITVTSGGEATGVDIRYRGERGHTVSGAAIGGAEPSQQNIGVSVMLFNVSSGFMAGTGYVRQGEGQNGFAINGVVDGEYEITARRIGPEGDELFASPPRRITVKGADVGGIELRLAPLASVSGKVVVGASPNACESKRNSSLEEVIVSARRDTTATSAASQAALFQPGGSVNDKGEFTISGLVANRYFISPRLPDENWHVKSIAAPAAAPGRGSAIKSAANNDVGRNGFTVKSGDKMTGVIVTITGGAASLRGKVAPEKEDSRLPARMLVHLTPAETTSADDVLRYAETAAGKDGAFEFKHIAPGKYRMLARAAPDDEPSDRPATPIAWDANERAKLRRETAAAKNEIELQPCGRVKDYVLRFNP